MPQYKNVTISEKSEAYELFTSKKFGKLDEHLQQLEVKRRRLEGDHIVTPPWVKPTDVAGIIFVVFPNVVTDGFAQK